jgi:hypothetical protein
MADWEAQVGWPGGSASALARHLARRAKGARAREVRLLDTLGGIDDK